MAPKRKRTKKEKHETDDEIEFHPDIVDLTKNDDGGNKKVALLGATRDEMTSLIACSRFFQPSNEFFWHGRLFGGSNWRLEPPSLTWHSSESPRADHDDTPEWLKASEYEDVDQVLDVKVAHLAELLRMSKNTLIYSGAGISVAAGIGQASRSSNRKQKNNLSTTAEPTFTHFALTSLWRQGLIHGWVQQNHDGLPQKAGFPQEKINEVHGSWYDPANPVVVYSGSLRSHECSWMKKDAESADLVIVVGTSLSGLNADQVATEAALRSLKRKKAALGMVMINLQQTSHDGEATLRIFGQCDDVLAALLSKLNIPSPTVQPTDVPLVKRLLVPYDKKGKRSSSVKMWLDLSPGALVKIVNENIRGADQPEHEHIGRDTSGAVIRWSKKTCGVHLGIQGASFLLGFWWLEAAQRGCVPFIPVVNVNPEMQR